MFCDKGEVGGVCVVTLFVRRCFFIGIMFGLFMFRWKVGLCWEGECWVVPLFVVCLEDMVIRV